MSGYVVAAKPDIHSLNNKAAPLAAFSFCAALGLRRRGGEPPTSNLGGKMFSNPRSVRRVPQSHRESSSEPLFESSRVVQRPTSWRTPGGARNGERGRALRGVLSLVSFFARAKKETRPRCGEPQLPRGCKLLDKIRREERGAARNRLTTAVESAARSSSPRPPA